MINANQQQILDSIDTQAESMRSLLEQVCDINSYTENTAGIDLVRQVFLEQYSSFANSVSEHSLPDHEVVDRSGKIVNLPIAKALKVVCRPECKKRVFLCIHLDTVYEPASPFQKCVEPEPGVLNGPGVIDAKGGAVIMLHALKAFEHFELASNIGWEAILNTDEEIGSPSSQQFVKERGKDCDFGLLFEPALPDGTLVDERKGSGNYSIVIRGNSVHSGRDFENGRNAIVLAARVASELHECNSAFEELTVNVARIDGGGPLNVVPDLAVLRVNIRVANPQQQQWIEQKLDEVVEKCNGENGFSSELHGGFFSPPKNLDSGTRALKNVIEGSAQDLGLNVSWRATGGVSDGNKLAAINLPNIDTLGARGDNMHNPNEFVILESLPERAKLTALILMRYASGEFSID